MQFYWQSKAVVQDFDPLMYADPSREFFYPTRLVLPDTQIRITGDLLLLPLEPQVERSEKGEEPEEEPGKGFRLPHPEETESQAAEDDEGKALSLPEPQSDMSIARRDMAGSSFRLAYDLQPRLFVETQFDHVDWQTAQGVDFRVRYAAMNVAGLGKIIFESSLWDGLLRATDELSFDGVYQCRLSRGRGLTDYEWEALIYSDYQKNSIDLGNALGVGVFPLLAFRYLEKSNVHYDLVWDYFRYRFEEMDGSYPLYKGSVPEWADDENDAVERHRVGNTLIFEPESGRHFLDLAATLPPLMVIYEGEAEFTLGFLATNIKTAYRETYLDWLFDPLIITETADLSPWVHLQQIFEYDLNEQILDTTTAIVRLFKLRSQDTFYLIEQELLFDPWEGPLTSSKSTLSFFGFQAYFLAEHLVPIEIDLDQRRWVPSGSEKFIIPSKLGIAYNSEPAPLYMWKNRIRLESTVSASWVLDFQRYTDSKMDFSFSLTLGIYKFLDLSFNITAHNTKSYRYIPEFANALDEPWVNPLLDLLKSFNVANMEDRYESSFNLKTIGVTAIHHLEDWELAVSYSGEQVLETGFDGSESYVWQPIISVILQWHPIPEIRHEILEDEEGINFRG